MIIKTPANYVLILSQNQLSSPRNHPMNCHVTAKRASTINEQSNNPISLPTCHIRNATLSHEVYLSDRVCQPNLKMIST